jgi:hypothetical protein
MKTAMYKPKRMLRQTQVELKEGKKLLNQAKARAKRAKGRLERHNAKRMVKLMDQTVDSIEEHRDLVSRQTNDDQQKAPRKRKR